MTSKPGTKKVNKKPTPKRSIPITPILFIITFLLYFATSAGNTPYDYFVRLADALLHGHYWLQNPPPWLNELVPGPSGQFYVVYPPMPAILLLPFVSLFGINFPQQILAHLLGAATVVLTYKLALNISKSKKTAIFSSLLMGFGNINWFLSSTGSAWYLGQVTACFLMTAAIAELLGKKRIFVISLFLGAAYISRLPTILSLPFFLFLLKDKLKKPLSLLYFTVPLLVVISVNALYNYIRFGVPWDKAYVLIPGVLSEQWYKKGLFHPSYIPRHLKTIFWSFPKFSKNAPYATPSWAGLSIWITTPAFIYTLTAPLKDKLVIPAWIAILLISIPLITHGTTGFAQFGYRFAVDFYPFLLLLTIKGITKTGLKWHHYLLLLLSITVNL